MVAIVVAASATVWRRRLPHPLLGGCRKSYIFLNFLRGCSIEAVTATHRFEDHDALGSVFVHRRNNSD